MGQYSRSQMLAKMENTCTSLIRVKRNMRGLSIAIPEDVELDRTLRTPSFESWLYR